jgi:hypothetical protein
MFIMISGNALREQKITGIPEAYASVRTIPNGCFYWMARRSLGSPRTLLLENTRRPRGCNWGSPPAGLRVKAFPSASLRTKENPAQLASPGPACAYSVLPLPYALPTGRRQYGVWPSQPLKVWGLRTFNIESRPILALNLTKPGKYWVEVRNLTRNNSFVTLSVRNSPPNLSTLATFDLLFRRFRALLVKIFCRLVP